MRTTTRSAGSRNRKTQKADGDQDDAGKHLARAMKFAKKFSPKKGAVLFQAAKAGKNTPLYAGQNAIWGNHDAAQ